MAEFSENRHISNLINMSCKVCVILGEIIRTWMLCIHNQHVLLMTT